MPIANAAARSVSASGTAAAITPIAIIPMVTAIQIEGVMCAPNRFIVTVALTHAHQAAARNAKKTTPSSQEGSPCIVCAIWPM